MPVPILKYPMKPLQHMMASQFASLEMPGTFSPLTVNVKSKQHSLRKRWGYSQDRNLGAPTYGTILYQMKTGNRYTLYLTATDLCLRQTGGSSTFSYLTPQYTTGTITNISGVNVTGSGTAWQGTLEGMPFILTANHNATQEPDSHWAVINSVNSQTSITLSSAYTGTTGAMNNSYIIREQYSVPLDQRWTWKPLDNYIFFGTGDTPIQYWDGVAATAASLDTTFANEARFITSFDNRIILADCLDDNGNRDPYMVRYSSITSPTIFDYGNDPSAGFFRTLETDDYIYGVGVMGSELVVFKWDSYLLYSVTGNSDEPFQRDYDMRGIGNRAPYSIVEVMGSLAWLGKDNFYMLNGAQAQPIGDNMRYKFYDIVTQTEAKNTWGFVNSMDNEVHWIANTNQGQFDFVWDYIYKEWFIYQFSDYILGAGSGAV